MTFRGSCSASHLSVIVAKMAERTAFDVLPAKCDWALARDCARCRFADMPVLPSSPEIAVSKLFLSNTFPRSPTREGSSPFSSPAKVCESVDGSLYDFDQLTLPASQHESSRGPTIPWTHIHFWYPLSYHPKSYHNLRRPRPSVQSTRQDRVQSHKIPFRVLLNDVGRISPTIRAQVPYIQVRDDWLAEFGLRVSFQPRGARRVSIQEELLDRQ